MGACSGKTKSIIDSAPVLSLPDYAPATDAEIDAFMALLRPLDLLMFRNSSVVSTVISQSEFVKTGSDAASHVEVVITKRFCDKIKFAGSEDTLLSWGSTLSSVEAPNLELGGATLGVQIRGLRNLIGAYLKKPGANIGVCRLLDNPTQKRKDESENAYYVRTKELKTKIGIAYDTLNGMMYDANPIALAAAVFPSLRPLRNATSDFVGRFTSVNKWMFCSEFVATLYQMVDVITDETDGVADGKLLNVQNVLPVDFLGYDADRDGIVKPICELPPKWIRPQLPPLASMI